MNFNTLKRLSVNFSKFTFVGIIVSLMNIFFVWLLIDILEFKTIISTTIVVGVIFLLKFYSYSLIGLIKKQFFKYSFIQILSAILNVTFTWILIDLIQVPTIIATSVVVVGLFFGRFLLFKITKLLVD